MTIVIAGTVNTKLSIPNGGTDGQAWWQYRARYGGKWRDWLATAKEFLREGAYAFVTGRRETEMAVAAKDIGGNVVGVQGDVANLADVDRLFARIKQKKGRLDIVFANAGVATLAPLGTIAEALYHPIFDVNVKGLLFTVQKALPLLPDGASIILNWQQRPAGE